MICTPEPAAIAQDSTPQTHSSKQIAPGLPVRWEITSSAAEVFELTIEQGKVLHFSIEKGDLILSTAVYGPTGAKLFEHTSQELETVEISIPADVAGRYEVQLRTPEILDEPRPFELKVEPFAIVTDTDRKDSEARKLSAEAEILLAKWTVSDLRQARDKFEQAAKTWASISDFSNASLATLKAADVCFGLSEFAEALKRYTKAEASAQKTSDRLVQVRALSQIGLINSYTGKNDLAQHYLTTALDLLKFTERDSTPLVRKAYGNALATMAEVTYSKGNFAMALDQFTEARKYLEQDRKAQAKVHRFLGYISGSLGDADKALAEISRAKAISQAINDKSGEGLATTLLGLFQTFTRKPHLAIESHKTALAIFRTIGDRHSEAIALNGMSQVYQILNDYPYALVNAESALSLFEATGALDFVASTNCNLAEIHQRSGNPERALTYLERCLALSRAGKKVRTEAYALSEFAIVYASQKRPDLAAKQQRKVQKFYERIGDRRGLATSLNNYGDFLLRIDQKQQALDAYNHSLVLSKQVGDKGILTTTLFNLARVNKALGNYEVGLEYIERSIEIIENVRADVGTPDLRALYFSEVRKHYDLCRDILMRLDANRPGEGFGVRAFLVSERSRARSLLDQLRESQLKLRAGAAAELLRREREAAGLIRGLAEYQMELSFDKSKDSEQEQVSRRLAQLNAEYQEIQFKLRSESSRQMPLANFEVTELAPIQNELRNGDRMLVEYALGDEQSYLWAITADSFHSYSLPPREEIEKSATKVYELMLTVHQFDSTAVGDYQAKVEAADNLYREKARGLSQILLGPVADQLRDRKLIFVTEGALQFVQFEALPVPYSQVAASVKPISLIETNEVVTIPSMTTLLAMRAARKRPASSRRVVAVIADPVFNRNDDRVGGREHSSAVAHAATTSQQSAEGALRDGPSRLVYASEEADAILAVAPRGTTMIARGFDASRETAMSLDIGGYQIIHFATHGFLDSELPELSGILLTRVDQNGSERNGLMALHDIYTLDLSAELTVLSACQTALGKEIRGEGLVGLTHSFMSAGSKSVVASLWKVDDRATASLMSDFYESMLRKGMSPVAALRAAKLKMMQDKRWTAPYYWAGFVFQGDYESRIQINSDSHLSLGQALLFLALISSGLIVFLRRRRRLSASERIK